MILKYSFEYQSNNNTLNHFLVNIAKNSNVDYEIVKNDSIIEFYSQGDEEQLTNLANNISKELPMSIFLTNTNVEACEDMPQNTQAIEDNIDYPLPFCPKCLDEVDNEDSANYYNPFYRCSLCKEENQNQLKLVVIENDKEDTITNYVEFFDNLANDISNEKKVKIETQSGTYIFEKINLLNNQNNKLLCTNLMNISSTFVAKKNEVVALASLEKPLLNLRFNEIYKQNNGLTINNADVKYVDDLFLYLLAKSLEKHNIDFLSYSNDNEFDIEIKTGFSNLRALQTPKVKILANDKLVLLENTQYDSSLMDLYKNFDQKSKAHFTVLLKENNLFGKSILNFYGSDIDDDNITLYTKEIDGHLDILNYKLPSSMEEVFEDIQSDDTGKRLFENYSKKYPKIIEKALNTDISNLNKNSIVNLWTIVESILGFENSILDNAKACMLEKGPRIDYKLFEQEKFYKKEFKVSRLIRSGMSFKLAGVDENTLSLGYVESYAHFISSIVDEVNEQQPLDGISLCGNLFADDVISKFVHKNITKNYKIYYNKDFGIQIP